MYKSLCIRIGTVVAVSGIATMIQADTVMVQVGGTSFTPQDIVVQPGDTVRWERLDGIHSATSGTGCTADGLHFNGSLNEANPSFEWTVPDDASGTIDYFCIPHCGFGMSGSILVDEGASIRFAAIASESIGITTALKTSNSVNILNVNFDNGISDRIQLGFEVEGAHAVVELSVVGTGHIEVRDLTSLTSTNYSEGAHEVVMGTGAHGFLGSGDLGIRFGAMDRTRWR